MLIGRERERAELADMVGRARHGVAGSLVLRGEAGVGKSALLADFLERTEGAQVLSTQGLETEAPFAFAALHRLLLPIMRLRDDIPAPQSSALRVAFGEEEGPPLDPFRVAIATLSMLTSAAEEQLLVCVVDDSQWLDPSSAEALLFAARRLGADRAFMLFAARDEPGGAFRADGIQEHHLAGLDTVAARSLLDDRLTANIDPTVGERLITEAGGNPLALLELPMELTAAQLEGSATLPEHLPLTARVEQAFLGRSRMLSEPTQALILVVAADDTGDPGVVRRAAETLGATESEWASAASSGLLTLSGSRVGLRHPLVRSAIYQAALATERRRAHRALADALHGIGDEDREAWHRASAADGPDEDVVDGLERVGARAERRGGYIAAMTAYRRASALTSDRSRIADLTFAAARNAWSSGLAGDAKILLALARESASDQILLNDLSRLRGRIEVNVGSAKDAHRIFVEASGAIAGTDPARALELAAAASLLRAYGADSGAALDLSSLPTTSHEADEPRSRCLKHLVVALTLADEQAWPKALECFDQAFAAGAEVSDLDVLGNLGNAALRAGADREQLYFYEQMLSRSRERGAVMAVIYALQRIGFSYVVNGDWAELRSTAEETLALSASIDQRALAAPALAWLTFLAAVQQLDDYDPLLEELDRLTAAHPLGILADPVHDLTRWAKGTRAAATGDAHGALHHLSRIRLPMLTRMAAVDRIDAAARAGNLAIAREWTSELSRFAESTGREWAWGAVAYGRAMTTASEDAEHSFLLALGHYAANSRPYDEARTHLAYGEWLRRTQRRVDAREHLRRALETFRDLRAEPLVTRATEELRSSGETARKRDPSTLIKLTPMELKVAQLVSSGLSNKDVAAQCWVSPRTVAFHLRNVFAKAGVTSRGELAQLDLV